MQQGHTLPRVKRERLIELVSFSISPEALVSLTRSLPARSTKLTCRHKMSKNVLQDV